MNLNVGVGVDAEVLATPIQDLDCLNIDVKKAPEVDVQCSIQNLPFINQAFENVYCFHVLEHIDNPAKGLKEIIRVAKRLVEIEVPHHFGRMAKSGRSKKGNLSLYHITSFNCMWFNSCLKNFVRCTRVIHDFPLDFRIHIWIYIEKTKKRMEKISEVTM